MDLMSRRLSDENQCYAGRETDDGANDEEDAP
jgi:hypothetical protein